jgi:hypothetical protein
MLRLIVNRISGHRLSSVAPSAYKSAAGKTSKQCLSRGFGGTQAAVEDKNSGF